MFCISSENILSRISFFNFFLLHVLPLSRMCKQIIRYFFWGGFCIIWSLSPTQPLTIWPALENKHHHQITNEKPPWLEESEAGSPQREPFKRWNYSYLKRNVIKTIAKICPMPLSDCQQLSSMIWFDFLFFRELLTV